MFQRYFAEILTVCLATNAVAIAQVSSNSPPREPSISQKKSKKSKPQKIKLSKQLLPSLLWDTHTTTIFHTDGTATAQPNTNELLPLTYSERVKIESALSNGNAKNADSWGKLFNLQLEEHFFELSKNESLTNVTFSYNFEKGN